MCCLKLPFLAHKIFTFYIRGVLKFKCPAPGPKGLRVLNLQVLLHESEFSKELMLLHSRFDVLTVVSQKIQFFCDVILG